MRLQFLLTIALVVVGCAIFVNGIEWLGYRMQLSGGAVGSVLAALGTALPETMLTAVALGRGSTQIGLGTVFGGPLVLSTMAFACIGAVVVMRQRSWARARLQQAGGEIIVPLRWFALAFLFAIVLGIVPPAQWKTGLAPLPAALYLAFVALQLRERQDPAQPERALYLSRSAQPPLRWILAQTCLGAAAMLLGSHFFVVKLEGLSAATGYASELLALFLSPLATEMTELTSSLIWTMRGQEHLALANIGGSMLLQATLPVALGLRFTPWVLGPSLLGAAVVALACGLWVVSFARQGRLTGLALLFPGLAYIAYLIAL